MLILKNFRFYKKKYKSDPIHNKDIKKVVEIIKQDKGCFNVSCEYFFNNTNNNQSVVNAYKQIKNDIQIVSLTMEMEVNEILGNQLASLLSSFHNLNKQEFKSIRDGFIEYVVLRWKTWAGKHSKVYIEPNLYYKRKQLFRKKPFRNMVADIVHIHRKKLIFEMYECKTTMRMFLSLIAPTPYGKFSYEDYKGYKNVKKQKQKQNYMHAFYDLINYKTDIKICEVAYITLAKSSDLKVNKIGKIPIITRELILSKYDELF